MTGTAFASSSIQGTATLTNGNLTAKGTSSTGSIHGDTYSSTGKFYVEITANQTASSSTSFGIAPASATYNSNGPAGGVVLFPSYSSGVVYNNQSIAINGIGYSSGGGIYSIAVDTTNRLVWFRADPSGQWNASSTADPASGTGGLAYAAGSNPIALFFSWAEANEQLTLNTGDSAFSGAVPSGFTSGWPNPAIVSARRRQVIIAC